MADIGVFGPLEPKRFVNRHEEMKAIGAALAASDNKPRIFYFTGGAGVGKTRLLREAREEFRGQYTFAGFYDFDESELHSNTRLQQRILTTLDPEIEHFKEFRAKRQVFLEARRIAPTAQKLEEMRRELGEFFVQGINEISAQKKLLFCFDTVETLQRESDTVQFPGEIGEAIESLAIEMLGWLIHHLPKMQNIVVLMAGRPKVGLDEQFEKAFDSEYRKFDLTNFSPEYVQEYLEALAETYSDYGEKAISRQFSELATEYDRIHTLTAGQPILLSFVTDLIHNSIELPEEFKLDKPLDADITEKKTALQVKVRAGLMNLVMNDIHSDVRLVLPYIALLRKGVRTDILHRALQDELPGWDRLRCASALEAMRGLSLAKPIPSDLNLPLERLYLHDEVYDMMVENEIYPHIELYAKVCERMIAYYSQEIEDAEEVLNQLQSDRQALTIEDEASLLEMQSELTAKSNRLKAKQLYYQLEADPFMGYAEYVRLTDQAIINHQVGLDMMLRDEMLRYFDLTHPDNWRLKRARQVRATNLSPERIMRGSAIRWVQRFIAHGLTSQAIHTANILQTDQTIHKQLRVADDPLFIAILKTYEGEAYLGIDTSRAIEILTEAIDLFENVDLKDESVDLRSTLQPRHLGRAYNNRGYAHARENSFHEAVHDYQHALPLLRATGLPHQTAGTLVNLAFAYTHTGQLLAAEILCHEAIRICQENKLDYLRGLGLNTLGIMDLAADRPNRAVALANQALRIFEDVTEGGDMRGMGLANLVLGKANRARAQLGIYGAQQTREMFERSERALRSGYETFRTGANWHEPARELEALQALGCLYSQWASWERTRENGSPSLVGKLVSDSQREFEMALERVAEKYVDVRADILNDMAELYWIQDEMKIALEYADKSDNAVRMISKNYFLEERRQPEEPWYHLYAVLGKNENLRGRIALKEGDLPAAAQHFTAASAYFDRFEGDPSARELAARRTYRMYRDLLDLRLSAKQLEQFRQRVELFQRQNLVPPWPQRTTTLGDDFNAVWSDLTLVLEL